ncbi:DNA mismatch repair protein MutS [Rhizoctonia solani]|uniref:DNA mismatch repair protein MutS n=1 Tax=Rhizoctonia solani TaxID=456999 RepID=A0A8H8P1E2_9AGAM|nr:DNA mismatch repair protein MutS [Rhizoctonia solani]QRW23455.1 DNA mismatch repair protein MutS [Rhizoctonia solani]
MMYAKEKPEATDLDSAVTSGFCSFIASLPPKSDDTIRLFERQDYYSAHGSDATFVATHVYHTLSVIKQLGKGKDSLPSVTLSSTVAKIFLREALTTRQLRIEIWTPEGGKGKNASGTRWELSRRASPGNLQDVEDLLFSNNRLGECPDCLSRKSPGIYMFEDFFFKHRLGECPDCDGCSSWQKGRRNKNGWSSVFADASAREIGVSEFPDNDLLSNFEALLIQLDVKECVMQADDKRTDIDLNKLREVIAVYVVLTERKSEFEQDLGRLLKGDLATTALPEYDLKTAMSAAAALISYLSLTSDSGNSHQYTCAHTILPSFMRLDASAVRALNLMPAPGLGGSVNLHAIETRQTLVEAFVNDGEARDTLRDDYLRAMPDFHRIGKRFQKGGASLEDVVRVYQAALKIPGLIMTLQAVGEESDPAKALIKSQYLDELEEYSSSLSKYTEMVEQTIDLKELDRHNYVIKPDYDQNLKRLALKLSEVRDGLDEEHQDVGQDLGLELDKKLHLENNPSHGYCFRLSKTDAKAIHNKRQYNEISTQKAGTLFTTSTLRELANEYGSLSDQYNRAQSGLVKEVVGIAGTGDLVIKEGRHPCLEVQEEIMFIPNDTELHREKSEFLIISGPNMGGKSTYIRQVGVIALMGQCGCFVPATEAQLPIFDSILARVGAGDSQLKGVCDQSFGIHVAELANFPENVVKLAKRKAEELEDFGGSAVWAESTEPDLSKEVTEEGAKILEQVLGEWAAMAGLEAGKDGDDVTMSEGSSEEQVRILREVFEKHRAQIEGNACYNVAIAFAFI